MGDTAALGEKLVAFAQDMGGDGLAAGLSITCWRAWAGVSVVCLTRASPARSWTEVYSGRGEPWSGGHGCGSPPPATPQPLARQDQPLAGHELAQVTAPMHQRGCVAAGPSLDAPGPAGER
jgi:hypothetical protein